MRSKQNKENQYFLLVSNCKISQIQYPSLELTFPLWENVKRMITKTIPQHNWRKKKRAMHTPIRKARQYQYYWIICVQTWKYCFPLFPDITSMPDIICSITLSFTSSDMELPSSFFLSIFSKSTRYLIVPPWLEKWRV